MRTHSPKVPRAVSGMDEAARKTVTRQDSDRQAKQDPNSGPAILPWELSCSTGSLGGRCWIRTSDRQLEQ